MEIPSRMPLIECLTDVRLLTSLALTAWKTFAYLPVCSAHDHRRYSFRTADMTAVLTRHVHTKRTHVPTYAHCRTYGNSYARTKHTSSPRFAALLHENVLLCTLLSNCVKYIFCIPRSKRGGVKETPDLTFKQPRSYISTRVMNVEMLRYFGEMLRCCAVVPFS